MAWFHYPNGSPAPPFRGRFDPEHLLWGLILLAPVLSAGWFGAHLLGGVLAAGLAIAAAGYIVHRRARARRLRLLRSFRRERDAVIAAIRAEGFTVVRFAAKVYWAGDPSAPATVVVSEVQKDGSRGTP